MMISLIFIVGFFSLFLLPITCLSILFSLQPNDLHHHHSAAAKPHLMSSIWRLLLQSFGSSANIEGKHGARSGVRRFGGQREGGEKEECRVCLCEVEQGEEISDLRCNHHFHKVCLDAWIGSGHSTCPLCRGRVFAPAEGGVSEVVMFEFSSLGSSRRARREGNWWLR